MRIRILPAILTIAALGGCAHDGDHSYAGSPGSTYDAALNPPRARDAVAYDPTRPIAPHEYGNSGGGIAPR